MLAGKNGLTRLHCELSGKQFRTLPTVYGLTRTPIFQFGRDRNGHGEGYEEKLKYEKKYSLWQKMNRPLWIVLFSGLGGFISYWILHRGMGQQDIVPSSPQIVMPSRKIPMFGGQWSLIDTSHQPFGSKELQGSHYLIYFGFTKCPDVCPTTLNYLISVKKYLSRISRASKAIKLVFVSVDPVRDTPQVLSQYLAPFNGEVIGVTEGSEGGEGLKECMKAFKVYARRVEVIGGGQGSYNVDHTSLTFLIDGRNSFVDVLNTSLAQEQAAVWLYRKMGDEQQGIQK